MNIQAKMISDLAKKIKSEPKSRDQVLEFLKSAKILAENGDLSNHYPNLKKVICSINNTQN